MRLRELAINPPLQARSEGSEVRPEDLDADFHHAIGLALVSPRELFRDLLEALDTELEANQGLFDETFHRRLIVGLEEQPDVAHPLNVRAHNVHDMPVLVDAFARYNVRKHRLGLAIAYHDALDYLPRPRGKPRGTRRALQL